MDYSFIKSSENPKVLTMLSGGKDSIAAILILKRAGLDVTAIHFVHKWGSSIPTEEAIRITGQYDIPIIVKDYSKEFCEAVNGYSAGRPCLLCKKQMYKMLLDYIDSEEYGWLCIGDNANDRTTIARIEEYLKNAHSRENLICSSYFGSEMGISLPNSMKVVRPLIKMTADDITDFLRQEQVEIKRINSTGDKYFEYHREGCPVQFVDIGVELNEDVYEKLKKYNDCITEYARDKGILASIHIPSTFIITIPSGYEEEAAKYLEKNGFYVDREVNSSECFKCNMIWGHVYKMNTDLLYNKTYIKVFERFLERLELFSGNIQYIEKENGVICSYCSDSATVRITIDDEVDIEYIFSEENKGRHEIEIFDNLILESFRTRKYQIDFCRRDRV